MTLLLAALMLAANPTVPEGTATSEPVQKAEKGEKRICKIDPDYTGSRMKKRLCLTATEWANKSANTANDLKNVGAR